MHIYVCIMHDKGVHPQHKPPRLLLQEGCMYVCTLYSTYVYSLYMYIAHISITAQIVHEQCVLALSDDPSSYPICASWRSFLYLHYFSQVGIGKKPAARLWTARISLECGRDRK
jgi:hypothetical protein